MPSPPPPPPLPQHQDPHVLEANGRYGGKPESPSTIVFLNVINTLTQLLLGAVAITAFSMANLFDYANSMSQHIYLCVIGYVILMSQAVLTLNSHAGWAYSLNYTDRRLIHGFLQIFGSIIALAGGIIRINAANEHFNTPHAITGIIAMVLTILSLIGGVLNFVLPRQTNTAVIKSLHSCLGSVTLSVAFICLCLAFNDTYKIIFGDLNGDLAISFTIFALAGILISAFTRIVKRFVYGVD